MEGGVNVVLPGGRFDGDDDGSDFVPSQKCSISSVTQPSVAETKFLVKEPEFSRWAKNRRLASDARRQQQKPGPLRFYEDAISKIDASNEVKEDFLMITHTGWRSVSYDVKMSVISNFTSKQCREEYLHFLVCPTAEKTANIVNLSPYEKL